MKTTEAGGKSASTRAERPGSRRNQGGRIHPVVIYPFRQPEDYADLDELYRFVGALASRSDAFARPITVIDRKTHYRMAKNRRFVEFRNGPVAGASDVLDAWCVDTCQMWYAGLGMAFERGAPGDVYWLVPGDFDYGTASGREVLAHLTDLPEICLELDQDLCVGEVEFDPHHSKHLIDTHGTFALLYNWFPAEAREIRQYTARPRSEFFALRHEFLGDMLNRRWYGYEQTVVLLLHAVFDRRRITRFSVGDVSDLPEGRDSLASAFQQVERTERVLKTLWRERNGVRNGWVEQFGRLDDQSARIRQAAMILLARLLG